MNLLLENLKINRQELVVCESNRRVSFSPVYQTHNTLNRGRWPQEC